MAPRLHWRFSRKFPTSFPSPVTCRGFETAPGHCRAHDLGNIKTPGSHDGRKGGMGGKGG